MLGTLKQVWNSKIRGSSKGQIGGNVIMGAVGVFLSIVIITVVIMIGYIMQAQFLNTTAEITNGTTSDAYIAVQASGANLDLANNMLPILVLVSIASLALMAIMALAYMTMNKQG